MARALPSPDKMGFLDHLEELRRRLVRSLLALVVGFAVCWGFSERIFHFVTEPMRRSGVTFEFIYTAPTEAFMLYVKMSFFLGIFVAAPYLLYQVWAFISPGLYPNEKSWAIPFVTFGSLFFIAGGLFGHYILFPMTFGFLGQYGNTGDMSFKPKISEYFDFYAWFVLGLALVSQMPVVIFILARMGLVTAGFLLRMFKYAFLGCFVVSAIITPSSDIATQTALAVPMLGLYALGIGVAWLFGKPRAKAPAQDVNAGA